MEEEGKDRLPVERASLRGLSDEELTSRVRSLAARERRATALLVAHLAELATRDLHLAAGYSSLFVFCRDALSLSEHDAYNRIGVARTSLRFPVVLDLVGAGAVNLTTVRLLGPHLTTENHRHVLDSARGRRRAEVEEIVARLAPFPEAPTFISKLAAARPAPGAAVAPPVAGGVPPATASLRQLSSAEVTPLAPDRYRLQLTMSGSTLEKLRLARDMLSHAVPSGNEAVVLDRALSVLLADLARARFAATPRPRPSRGTSPDSRQIPAEVKRTVWLRDLGRCAFVGTEGHRCNERAFVEFHHLRPYAAGGEPTAENIQLRCRRHNRYESQVFFADSRANTGQDTTREPAV